MLSTWPIRNKLLAGLVLLLVIVALLSWGGLHGLYSYRSLVRSLSRRVPELPLANRFSQDVSDLRIALSETQAPRELELSGADVSPFALHLVREEFRLKLDIAHGTLRQYRQQLEDNSENDRIGDSRREWLAVKAIDESLARISQLKEDEGWLLDEIRVGRLRTELEYLQGLAAELPNYLYENISEFKEHARHQYRTLLVLTWITSVFTVSMFALFVKLFYQWIFRPLRVLIKGSRRVAGGQFNYRIHLKTHDEMSELAAAMNDMTSRFQDIRDDLDRQVQERTKQVVRSEQLASVGFLAAGVAHEINNPLAAIAMCAESLEDRLGEAAPADEKEASLVRNYLQMIQTEAFRCKGITEKLLDFSRIGDVHRQNTDLQQLVQDVADMIRHMGKYEGKHLELAPGPAVIAPVNAQQIKQVVLNLVVNGLDALEPGGTVRVAVDERDGEAMLSFVDDGCGMTADVLEHLFEPFFTRRRGGQGTGLGLSIAYRIVADHDGSIEASSAGPGGARGSACGCHWFKIKRSPIIDTKPHNRLKLLFADDERSLQELMSVELPRLGHEVTVCPDGATAIAALERNTYDCILVDLNMPHASGIDVIAKAKELSPDTEAVVLTGKSTMDSAISALRHGAFDYLTKPCKLIDLKALLNRVAEKRDLTNKYRAVKRQLERLEGGSQLIGSSAGMQQVRQIISKIAPTDSTVLVLGETGTGKELVARALHDQSLRAERPFVAINCGGLPESLIESELFGHRKGAFTGADEHRVGLFEVANGGTLFLDEIGELPKAMQAKLLRVLESGEIRRVGDNESFIVDVRAVCATHRDLEQMVVDGEFRQDLMFRINTFEIRLPPLRERIEDIAELARHLLKRLRPTLKPGDELFEPDALRMLEAYSWPGNVRELANVIEHAAILGDRGPIAAAQLPNKFGERKLRGPHFKPAVAGTQTLREIELSVIQQTLERHKGNKPRAAEELGISLKTLYNKLNQVAAAEQQIA